MVVVLMDEPNCNKKSIHAILVFSVLYDETKRNKSHYILYNYHKIHYILVFRFLMFSRKSVAPLCQFTFFGFMFNKIGFSFFMFFGFSIFYLFFYICIYILTMSGLHSIVKFNHSR